MDMAALGGGGGDGGLGGPHRHEHGDHFLDEDVLVGDCPDGGHARGNGVEGRVRDHGVDIWGLQGSRHGGGREAEGRSDRRG